MKAEKLEAIRAQKRASIAKPYPPEASKEPQPDGGDAAKAAGKASPGAAAPTEEAQADEWAALGAGESVFQSCRAPEDDEADPNADAGGKGAGEEAPSPAEKDHARTARKEAEEAE